MSRPRPSAVGKKLLKLIGECEELMEIYADIRCGRTVKLSRLVVSPKRPKEYCPISRVLNTDAAGRASI